MDYYQHIPTLLLWAWLIPLASFAILFVFGRQICESKPKVGGYIAATAIVTSCLISFAAMFAWVGEHFPEHDEHFGHHGHHADAGHGGGHGHDKHGDKEGHSDKEEHGGTKEHGGDKKHGSKEEHADEEKHDDKKAHDGEAEKHDEPKGTASLTGGGGPLLASNAVDCFDEPAPPAGETPPAEEGHGAKAEAGEGDEGGTAHKADAKHAGDAAHGDTEGHDEKVYIAGEYYTLVSIGSLVLSIGYYIDALTITMFCMVTLIASCIHFYAMGYMHDEEHDITDHEVTLEDGSHLTRPGRYYRFFQYLSLFCFSMLGIVVAGNIAMVFVFWELVGICSYFLIGFYVERQSASTAANKAFIVNRVGDFGMIIGLMALWTSLGTFTFGDVDGQEGIFSLVRPASTEHALQTPDGMVQLSAKEKVSEIVLENRGRPHDEIQAEIDKNIDTWRTDEDGKPAYGYWLLIVAGAGIFCGCVGKSAQFPLHTWLPDAMEGPTPVSALVHSATMVAAGVYLVARFYPVFTPEVLLIISISGCATLFLGATIAITATDIKRVLAYSTVSQLGYMMLALGVGGWIAGVMHLITHAFFKSLLFMCSGSVIHAVHTNEMTEMGGLRKKMPVTAYTMLIGCLAIAGAGVPFLIGLSGYYSKDLILEQAYSFAYANNFGLGSLFFIFASGGAAITTFYMFRLWYMTFAGEPRDEHRYEHAHESPPVMTRPLILLSVFAIAVAWAPPQALLAGGVALVVAAVLFGKFYGWSDFVSYPVVIVATLAVWLVLGASVLETSSDVADVQKAKEQERFEALSASYLAAVETDDSGPGSWAELIGDAKDEASQQHLGELYGQGVVLYANVTAEDVDGSEAVAIVAHEPWAARSGGFVLTADGAVADLSADEFQNRIKSQQNAMPNVVDETSQNSFWLILSVCSHVIAVLTKYIAEILVTALAGVAAVWVVSGSEITTESARRLAFQLGGVGAALLLITGLWGGGEQGPLMLEGLLQQAYPDGALLGGQASYFSWMTWTWPPEPVSHDYKVPITLLAFSTAAVGFTLATLMYGVRYLNAEDARRQFNALHHFLRNKWWFDELYDFLFVRPCLAISSLISSIDRRLIDRLIDGLAVMVRWFATTWEAIADRAVVDGFVNGMASWIYSTGLSFRAFQTGNIRQYVMFIAIGAVVLFLLITFFLNPASLAQG